MRRIARGLDGCPRGWVVVTLVDGEVEDVEVVGSLAELEDDGAPVGIDIPVGLLDVAARDADLAARELLPGRSSSVFNAPPRGVVEAWRDGRVDDHAAACALARELTGSGISQQAWRLVPKIAEVDAEVARGREVLEVHPELAFALVVGEPLPRKRSWAGLTTRRGVLGSFGIELPDRFLGDSACAPDDVLDAAVCAWVADGAAKGLPPVAVPDPPTQMVDDRPVLIHARMAPMVADQLG
jgi:predicted RNase H-like nuclease